MQGFHDIFEELLNEMRDTTATKQKADQVSKQATHAHSRYLDQKILNDSSADENIDAQATSVKLLTKI